MRVLIVWEYTQQSALRLKTVFKNSSHLSENYIISIKIFYSENCILNAGLELLNIWLHWLQLDDDSADCTMLSQFYSPVQWMQMEMLLLSAIFFTRFQEWILKNVFK